MYQDRDLEADLNHEKNVGIRPQKIMSTTSKTSVGIFMFCQQPYGDGRSPTSERIQISEQEVGVPRAEAHSSRMVRVLHHVEGINKGGCSGQESHTTLGNVA